MKRYWEYTEEELVEMDRETINRLIDYECALDGVPLLPPNPGPAPSVAAVAPDKTSHKIGDWYFESAEDAGKVLSAIVSVPVFKAEGWSEDRRLKPCIAGDYNYPSITTEQMLSESLYNEKKATIEKYKMEKSNWDRVDEAYRKGLKGREGIVERVMDAISDAIDKQSQKQQMRSKFAIYLDLADNNATVAMNFLVKACPQWATDYPEIVQELCPGYGEKEERGK